MSSIKLKDMAATKPLQELNLLTQAYLKTDMISTPKLIVPYTVIEVKMDE